MIAVALAGFGADYLFNAAVARAMTPHEYGDFRVAWAFASFFGVAVLLGGDRAAPKALAPAFEQRELARVWEYLRFYFELALGLSLVIIAATWIGGALHVRSYDAMDHHAVSWVVFSVPISAAGALVSRALQSAQRPALAAMPWRLGVPILNGVLVAGFLALRGSLHVHEVILLATATVLMVTAWQWHHLRRLEMPELQREPKLRTPTVWLGLSMPMMGVFLVALALNQSDLYFLEILGDEQEVGHYAAAMTITHLILIIQTAIVGLLAPLTQLALERGPEATRETLRQGQRILLGAVVPATVLLVWLAPMVLSTFGPTFDEATLELRLLVLGNLVWAAVALSTLWLQYTHRGLAVVAITAATLIADSALNLLLIPDYGKTGAAASTALTTVLAALAVALLHWRYARRESLEARS